MKAAGEFSPQAGRVPAGRYRLGRVLGRSGWRTTYLAADLKLGCAVAVREFRDPDGDPEPRGQFPGGLYAYSVWRERYFREAGILAACRGIPHIARMCDCFEEDGASYIVTEFLEGTVLKDCVAENGPMDGRELARSMCELLGTVDMVHAKGIVHCGISPESVLLTRGGETALLGFGSARKFGMEDRSALSDSRRRGFAAPELFRERDTRGPWTDLYALCAVMYFCLTGERPPHAVDRLIGIEKLESSGERAGSVDRELEKIVLKGMSMDRDERYMSAALLRDALRRYLSGGKAA